MYKIISSANNDSFTSSFLILIPFISLSCLITIARISSNMLNKSGESGHSCLFPDFRGKAFKSFTIEYDVNCGFVVQATYILESIYHFTYAKPFS